MAPKKQGSMPSVEDRGELSAAIAADLRLLAGLQGKELTADQLGRLRAHPFQEYLGLMFRSEAGASGLAALDDALAAMASDDKATDGVPATIDLLAADYADIYLTGRFRTAPSESAWTHPEGLERQEAMFTVRSWYRRFGLEVENWRVRPDDHLVVELEFVAHLLESEPAAEGVVRAGSFLDRHLLMWAPAFYARVAARAATPYYAALATLGAAYLEEARLALEELSGQPREKRASPGDEKRPTEAEPRPYFPGAAPSW